MSQKDNLLSLSLDIAADIKALFARPRKTLITNSGRFYLHTNGRFVTDSDDNYGPNYYQFTEGVVSNTVPHSEWEHMGQLIPKGTILHDLYLAGRINNVEVLDAEIAIELRHPTPITRWETGMDNDGEDLSIIIYQDWWWNNSEGPAFTGNINDTHRRQLDLKDYVVPEDCYLTIHVRPSTTISATRYFNHTLTWVMTLP